MVEATATPSAMPTPKPASIAKPAVKPKPEKYMQAVGTEPFWTIDVLPKARLRYSTPDMLHGVIVNAVERHSGTTVRYAARFNGRPFTLELVPVKCSDGMSDTTYPLKATFVHSGRTDHGCARMR